MSARKAKESMNLPMFVDRVLAGDAPYRMFEKHAKDWSPEAVGGLAVQRLAEGALDAGIAGRVCTLLEDLPQAKQAIDALDTLLVALPEDGIVQHRDALTALLPISEAAVTRLVPMLSVAERGSLAKDLIWDAAFDRPWHQWHCDRMIDHALTLLWRRPERAHKATVDLPLAPFGRAPRGQRRYLEIRATLLDADNPPWRRFLIDAQATFRQIHAALQAASGTWLDYHLFAFRPDSESYINLAATELPDEPFEFPVALASHDTLITRLAASGTDTVVYEYDYGDSWLAELKVEAVRDLPERFHRRLIDGALAFPPEDCGGTTGFEQVRWVARRESLEDVGGDPEEILAWLGDWKPDAFDEARIRKAFDRKGAPAGV